MLLYVQHLVELRACPKTAMLAEQTMPKTAKSLM